MIPFSLKDGTLFRPASNITVVDEDLISLVMNEPPLLLQTSLDSTEN